MAAETKTASAAPHDHLATSPDRGVRGSCFGGVCRAGGCPTVCAGVIPSTRVKRLRETLATPNNHFASRPDCAVKLSWLWREGRGSCPTVRVGIVPAARVQFLEEVSIESSPHNHFAASPNGGVIITGIGHVIGAGRRPGIRVGIVSAAGVQGDEIEIIKATPHNHFAAGPHCSM